MSGLISWARTAVIAGALAVAGAAAHAAGVSYTYVGSWQVDAGPNWSSLPPAYTGQEAAALLFGGAPSDYAISTAGTDPNTVNNLAWYSILGVAGGSALADTYFSKTSGGLYYDGGGFSSGDLTNPASSYVQDNATGATYTNYAFAVTLAAVPGPAGLSLMLGGLGALAVVVRRRRRSA